VARTHFREGDVVEVVTVDAGRQVSAYYKKKPRPVERWRAVILKPSPFGSGWWIVKKMSGQLPVGRTYTVPSSEMTHIGREASPQSPGRMRDGQRERGS
jgi:hypothetical protein